jgi:hypothetical protein
MDRMSLTSAALFIGSHPTESDVPRLTDNTDGFLFVIEGQLEYFHSDEGTPFTIGDGLIIDAMIPCAGRAFGGKKPKESLRTLRETATTWFLDGNRTKRSGP